MTGDIQTFRVSSDLTVPYSVYAQSARVGAKAHLDDVRVHSLHAELDNLGATADQLRPQVEIEVDVTPVTAGSFVIAVTYSVDLVLLGENEEDSSDEEAEVAASVKVGVAGLYGSEGLPEDLKDDELKAYAASAGVLALHPYAREVVSTTVQRFGLPSLLMPPLRIVTDRALVESPNPD